MKIDFDKLLKDYNSGLVTKLRGFNHKHDYLQYWVPGSDKFKSLINLIEALFEANIFIFSIVILKGDKYLIDDLKLISKNISKLKISEDEKKYEALIILDKLKYKPFTEKKIKVNQIKKDNFIKLNQLNKNKKNYNILKNYEISLKNHNLNANIKKNKSEENMFFEVINGNNKIFLKINEEKKIINECWHDFKEKNNVSIVVDKFCQVILNKSIQEAAEHGTIYLEYSIRPDDKDLNIKGVILPKQVGGIFFDLHECINKIYIKIKQKYNFKDGINKEYPDSSNEWLKTSGKQKLFKLNKCLFEKIVPILKIKKDDIFIHGVEHNNRIIIKISKELERKKNDEVNYIIKIENLFKHYIDNRLELFILEKKDNNRLRLSNSPQKI